MRVAVDLRPLLEPFESGVTVYTKAMVDEFLKNPLLELDLFYQARLRCPAIHERYPQARHLPISNTWFHLRSLFRFPKLPLHFFKKIPDLIWLPDRRPFYKTELPIVMTVHDRVPEQEWFSLSLKGKLWQLLFSFRRLEKLCSGLLFPSLAVAQSLRSSLPWEVTYEGAQLARQEQKPKNFPVKNGFVLSLAPLDPRKRLPWIFEMANRFPKISFVCAGIKNQDRRFSRFKIPKKPNVFFWPAVSEPEKRWLYSHAAVFLALSRYEGFDLPALEATHCKTPVILSDIPVHRELYKNTSFVKNIVELQAALYLALDGNGKVPELRGDYSWEKAAKRASLFFFRILLNKDR